MVSEDDEEDEEDDPINDIDESTNDIVQGELVEDSLTNKEEDEEENSDHAWTIPSDPEDQPKFAIEQEEELNPGEDPKISTNPSPSKDKELLEELEEEEPSER